ncbi:MAG TPA: MIP/aquaporin family protein [Planctomycetaceae bacterium]
MTPYVAEFVGTALLLLLGDGVVANVVLRGTKGNGGGWIVITWGWAIAVFVGVFTTATYSGGHLNPAVTVGLAIADKTEWADVPAYVAAQMLGAMFGAMLVWLQYHSHFGLTEDRDAKLAVFCTGPAVRNPLLNLVSEVIGTFVLVFGALYLASSNVAGPGDTKGGLGALDSLPVALLVLGIGLSLGGTTGYAINPARDLGPRVVHALLPIPGGKRDSDWGYAWVPVAGPLIGGAIAAALYLALGGGHVPLPSAS